MAARAISSATVCFGVVSIPVKLYTPTDSSGQITLDESSEPEGKIIDLMEALKASLAGGDAPAKGPKRAAGSKRSSSSKPARKKAGSRR